MDLKGKTINFLGDSITEGCGVSDVEANRYDNVIKRKSQLKKVNNYGIGGTRIAYQRHPSQKARYDQDFCARSFDMDKSADIIIVYGGINDYLHGDAPIGMFGDKGRETFCGSVYYLMDTICKLYPNAIHVFFTPAHCFCDDGFSLIEEKTEAVPEPVNKTASEVIKEEPVTETTEEAVVESTEDISDVEVVKEKPATKKRTGRRKRNEGHHIRCGFGGCTSEFRSD